MTKLCSQNRNRRRWTRPWVVLPTIVFITYTAGCSMPGGNDNANENMNGGMVGERFTVTFDGDGGATSSGTTDFEFNGASFSGGTVRTVGQPDLYGSGSFAYEVLEGSTVAVTFENPIDLLELFFVTSGNGETVLTAFDADGNTVGTATAGQPGDANEEQRVELSTNAVRVQAVHTGGGEGWIDDFAFRFAETGSTSGGA